jgi:hypothetical protein
MLRPFLLCSPLPSCIFVSHLGFVSLLLDLLFLPKSYAHRRSPFYLAAMSLSWHLIYSLCLVALDTYIPSRIPIWSGLYTDHSRTKYRYKKFLVAFASHSFPYPQTNLPYNYLATGPVSLVLVCYSPQKFFPALSRSLYKLARVHLLSIRVE